MEELSDRTLVSQLQVGNLDALGTLFDRHRQMVYRTALGITGDPDAAADLLQDVFLRLHRFARQVDVERPLEPWLYRVTVNLTCTWVKRRRWFHPLEDIAEWFVGDTRQTPAGAAETAEEWRALNTAVAALPLPHRTVIVMYYVNELSLEDIADIIDVPVGTVKSRLHYGRQTLKKLLNGTDKLLPEMAYEFT